jgi:hypothetical protein
VAAVRIRVFDATLLAEARRATTPQRADIAEQIVDEGQADAAVRTGEYRGGMAVEVDGDIVRAVDTDPEAAYKEYGTADTPAHAALTNAARRHGRYRGVQPKGR